MMQHLSNLVGSPDLASLHKIRTLFAIDLSQNELHSASLPHLWPIHAVTIDLSNNKLGGTIPSELLLLPSLQVLNLGANLMSGSLPQICPATLTHLYVHSNHLSGPFPACLGNMTSLLVLQAHHNNLTGPVPSGLRWLTKLTDCKLHGNALSGTVPDLDLSQLSSLQSLTLAQNQLFGTIPSTLSNTVDPANLTLADNWWSCPVPTTWATPWQDAGATTCLTSQGCLVDLYTLTGGAHWSQALGWRDSTSSACHWSGVTCDDQGSVVQLDLSARNLAGRMPAHVLYNLDNSGPLRILKMQNNQLTGSIPLLGQHLEVVDLAHNHFTGSLEDHFFSSTALTRVNLGFNLLTGTIPAVCMSDSPDGKHGPLSGLQTLDLSNNRFEGVMPSFLGCSNMQHLDLSNNSLSGPVDLALGQLCMLHQLDLSSNHLDSWSDSATTDSVMCTTGAPVLAPMFPAAVFVDLSRNNISGTLPSGLFSGSLLQVLDLSYNNISGPLPLLVPGPAPLPLRSVSLSHNRFDGVVQAFGSDLSQTRLEVLDLAHNRIEACKGPWALPTSLKLLLLDHNYLSGNLLSMIILLENTSKSHRVPHSFVFTLSTLHQDGWACPLVNPLDHPMWADWEEVFCAAAESTPNCTFECVLGNQQQDLFAGLCTKHFAASCLSNPIDETLGHLNSTPFHVIAVVLAILFVCVGAVVVLACMWRCRQLHAGSLSCAAQASAQLTEELLSASPPPQLPQDAPVWRQLQQVVDLEAESPCKVVLSSPDHNGPTTKELSKATQTTCAEVVAAAYAPDLCPPDTLVGTPNSTQLVLRTFLDLGNRSDSSASGSLEAAQAL